MKRGEFVIEKQGRIYSLKLRERAGPRGREGGRGARGTQRREVERDEVLE